MKYSKLALAMTLLLAGCQSENPFKEQKAVIKVALNQEPTTLDPRFGSDLYTANVLLSIYEGLMRLDYNGNVTPGVALSADVSPDLKTYTFNLRDTTWSDGTPLTAKDFEETWKSLLNSQFPAPNANQLYYIKGAKAFKEGSGTIEEVGIKSLNDKTLVVELENPVPYFLKLVSTYFYLPTNPKVRTSDNSESVLSNGPFMLKEWKHNDEIVLVKNPHYWDAKIVSMDAIVMPILNEDTSFKMFELGQLDRVGSPVGTLPQDSMPTLRHQHVLRSKAGAGTHLFRFNTEAAPFNNMKMRKAFNAALNRKEIVEHVTQGNQIPAEGIVPPIVGWKPKSFYKDNDITDAWRLFQAALIEMNIDKDHLPKITLSYSHSDRNHKIAQAVQQQWNKAFGIDVQLLSKEFKLFNAEVLAGNYQIAIGSWYADFNDPISFLEIFNSKTNSANRTNWSDADYTKLLEASNVEKDETKRFHLLKQAEALLMEEMPIAPLFFASFNFVESEEIGGVGLSDLGILDFKYAFIDKIENFDETLQ